MAYYNLYINWVVLNPLYNPTNQVIFFLAQLRSPVSRIYLYQVSASFTLAEAVLLPVGGTTAPRPGPVLFAALRPVSGTEGLGWGVHTQGFHARGEVSGWFFCWNTTCKEGTKKQLEVGWNKHVIPQCIGVSETTQFISIGAHLVTNSFR